MFKFQRTVKFRLDLLDSMLVEHRERIKEGMALVGKDNDQDL